MARSRRRREHAEPLRLSEVVAGVYPGREPSDVKAIRAFAWWQRAVPARVARNARPVELRRGVLTVHTTTHVWAHELEYLKADLLAELSRVAPESRVRSIRVRVGKLPPMPDPIRHDRLVVTPLAVNQLPEELARALAAIGDGELRSAVIKAAAAGLGTTAAHKGPRPAKGR